MKFLAAWSEVASENRILKFGLFFATLAAVALAAALCRLALKEPLVIERACASTAASLASPEHTAAEIESFVREIALQRFDSTVDPVADYLSAGELAARAAEQKALQSRKMAQRIVVNTVSVSKDAVTVDADRILSIGNVRSALIFPFVVTLATTARSASNPYGLSVVATSDAKPQGERK